MDDVVERVARAIAEAQGDNFADAFKNKQRWIAKRGMSGGRFRDINEPFQSDYIEAAKAAIRAMLEGREPVAWRYENDDRTHNPVTVINVTRWRGHAGWTETSLYDLSALKEAVK